VGLFYSLEETPVQFDERVVPGAATASVSTPMRAAKKGPRPKGRPEYALKVRFHPIDDLLPIAQI
jgi:hypothetical protein